jgi:hypothetical protein
MFPNLSLLLSFCSRYAGLLYVRFAIQLNDDKDYRTINTSLRSVQAPHRNISRQTCLPAGRDVKEDLKKYFFSPLKNIRQY